jgi:hypothetical protein
MDEFEKPTRRTGIPPFGGGSWLRHPPKFLPKETAGGGIAYLIVGKPKYIYNAKITCADSFYLFQFYNIK